MRAGFVGQIALGLGWGEHGVPGWGEHRVFGRGALRVSGGRDENEVSGWGEHGVPDGVSTEFLVGVSTKSLVGIRTDSLGGISTEYSANGRAWSPQSMR